MDTNQKNDSKWDITAKRFVAFFDMLGFKDRIMRESNEKIYEDLTRILERSETTLHNTLGEQPVKNLFGDSDIHIVKFSDSVVLFSKNDTVENFILFLISARFLFYSFLKENFLIKGGMAYGKISLDREKQLYFGQPIIDAYFLEEDVNYIGVVAHNSIDKFKQNIDNTNKFYSLLTQLFFEGKSPLKSGLITHLNLNWFLQLVGNENLNGKSKDDIKKDIIIGLKKYYLSVAGSPRRYIDNTIDFLNKNDEITLDKINLSSK